MSTKPDYNRGRDDAFRWSITWLHKRADSMNDDKARAILNSAAFSLGVEVKRPMISPPQADREAVLKRPQGNNADEWGVFLEEYEGSIPYVAVQIAEAIDAAAATRKDIDIGIKSLQMLGYRADGTPAVDREAVREAVKAMKEAKQLILNTQRGATTMGWQVDDLLAALTTAIAKLEASE